MSSAAVRSKAVVLLLFICCLLLLPLIEGLVFRLQSFVSFLCLQSSRLGRELEFYVLNAMSLYHSLALSRGATDWPVLCDCGISWLYSLTFIVFYFDFK